MSRRPRYELPEVLEERDYRILEDLILQDAYRSIEHGWTQGAWARSAAGRGCQVQSRQACSWCFVGALYRGVGRLTRLQEADELFAEILLRLYRRLGILGSGGTLWNDDPLRTKDEVLARLANALKGETTHVTL